MLVTVAGERPIDAFRLMDEPLWRVVYVFHHLMDREQERALIRRRERVDEGHVMHMALNDPPKLTDELREVQAAIREWEDGTSPRVEVDSARARGLALLARIRAGRATDPNAIVAVSDDHGRLPS